VTILPRTPISLACVLLAVSLAGAASAKPGPQSDLVLLLGSDGGETIFSAKDASVEIRVWCVRGGAGVDDQ
jgi:hypothetical protein